MVTKSTANTPITRTCPILGKHRRIPHSCKLLVGRYILLHTDQFSLQLLWLQHPVQLYSLLLLQTMEMTDAGDVIHLKELRSAPTSSSRLREPEDLHELSGERRIKFSFSQSRRWKIAAILFAIAAAGLLAALLYFGEFRLVSPDRSSSNNHPSQQNVLETFENALPIVERELWHAIRVINCCSNES